VGNRGGRRAEAKAATRAKILEAARSLFTVAGYEHSTMREIARMVGMSTGAIFVNFTDKAALYRAVFGHAPLTAEEGRAFLLAARQFVAKADPTGEQVRAVLAMVEEA
jgi:AcrR family transcriptional regulator